ncbi:MAG: hypothetical protein CM15mP64_7180 [Candidatus Neomarinimicrobiota bacterium]|nr:MAG: hypothetical protein CM15mP64_7180 [Candidatus Neomarinimicrobiota bacterium]
MQFNWPHASGNTANVSSAGSSVTVDKTAPTLTPGGN